jgi:hypothetical protein
MLKGIAITPPVIGRISIGKVVERNGKRLPEKDDQFTITSQVQGRDGWLNHPYDEALRTAGNGKLRSIPVRMLFGDPDLNLRAEYSLFDRQTGRPICVGNGETCRRATETGMESLPCPTPSSCELGRSGGCKPYGRLNVVIGEEDETGTFIFRTTSYNSIRTLAARLSYFRAVSGGLLACIDLELRLRGKSTTQSHRSPIYYVDLTARLGRSLEETITNAREVNEQRKASGFDQAALDDAARAGFANSNFEESEEEGPAVVDEFYSEPQNDDGASDSPPAPTATGTKPTLKDKLERKAAGLSGESE